MADERRSPGRYEELTRDQLVSRLRDADRDPSLRSGDDSLRLVHDLEVHQIELEMQNRELREAQALLEESRARLADLYEFAPVAYVTVGEPGRILEANLTAAALFGVPRGTLEGTNLVSLAAESQRRNLRDHLRRCVAERTRVESEITFVRRDLPPVIAHIVSVPVLAPGGTATRCKTTLTDITELKRIQEKLRFLAQASATLGSSFDYRRSLAKVAELAVPVLADICIVDLVEADGRLNRLEIAFADPSTGKRLGHFRSTPPRNHSSTPVGSVIRSKEPLLFAECPPASLVSSVDGFEHELLIKAAGAQSMVVVPLVARDTAVGAITLISAGSGRRYTGTSLATARDLAAHAAMAIDNARLYEKAQQAIRAREDILSFVSHDMRNPLMGILLTTETMLKGARVEGERRKAWRQLERIRRGVQQMRHMIDDLLDIAAMDAGRLTVSLAPCPVGRLLEDVLAVLGPIAGEKGLALRVDPSSEPIVVRADRERVIQVFSNLIGNAIKFTPQDGTITIAARAAGGKALLSVSDTGPGISPVVRPHIFERFWQADEAARKGRGLGLYIAKALVEAHGGAIWVDSLPGGGATFSFTLPLASPAEVDSLRSTMETTRDSLGHGPIVGPG
jgi:PAS domain S-box-containing protein